jgi:NAD(P)-dependent dehydrogenase (short-subunit alcohol dehydrogenase family)
MDTVSLKDRGVVIIGGTAGLGLSAAQTCLQAGALVVVTGRPGRDHSAAATVLGARGCIIESDAQDPRAAAAAIRQVESLAGGFHALYHVAGGSGRRWGDGPLHELTDEGWAQTLQLNLTSLMYSCRATVRYFLDHKQRGSILAMTSVLGHSPSPRYFATHAYAAAKSGAIGFIQSSAAYYASMDIRFNAIAPGLVDTPMAQRAAGDEEILRFIKTKQPLDGGRIGRSEDLNAAVLFFLSDASAFVTGQVLSVDGGWSVCEGQYASDTE